MDNLDIQTAQLIIQLARDDIYQFDDNSFGNNQDGRLLSDLEFALAEQEREFMQYWMEYRDTQINQNAGAQSPQAGASGNASGSGNVGNSVSGANQGSNVAVAGPSRVPTALAGPSHLQNGVSSSPPQPRPATPINLIDDDDDDDLYVNPYEPAPPAISISNERNRSKLPERATVIPIYVGPQNHDDHDGVRGDPLAELATTSSSSSSRDYSNNDNRRPNNPSINAANVDDTDPQHFIDDFFTPLFSTLATSNSQPTGNDNDNAPSPSASTALPDDGIVDVPHPSSPTLEQLLSELMNLTNNASGQASSSSTVNHVQASTGTSPQIRQAVYNPDYGDWFMPAGPSNPAPQRTNTFRVPSPPTRPLSPDDHNDLVEVSAGYTATAPIVVDVPLPKHQPPWVTDLRPMCLNAEEELSDDEGSIFSPAEPNVECHFCKDACPISTTINTSCNHHLCRGCLSRLIGICLKDETAYPPKCCDNRLQINELRILDHSLRQQFEAKVREYETPIPVRVYCHRCGEFLDSNSSTITTGSSSQSAISIHTSRYCDACFVRTCVSCKHASHPTRGCQETPDEKALKNLAQQRGWQTCPVCKAVVELRAGCYHVMCRCTAQFCYLCATTWKKCNCPAFDEDRLMAMALEA